MLLNGVAAESMQLRLHNFVEQRPAAAGYLPRDGVRASAGGAHERFHDSFGGGGLGCCTRVLVLQEGEQGLT